VAALAEVAAAMTAAGEIPGAVGRYQDLRLASAASHVAASERATAAYLAHAAHNPRTGA
jgi:hypothetical protein